MTDYLDRRQQRLFARLRELEIQRFLITSPWNVSYLTGFTGGDSYLFVDGEKLTIWSDARYEQQIAEECPSLALMIRSSVELLVDAIPVWWQSNGLGDVHVETTMTSYAQWLRLESKMEGSRPIPVTGVVERLRERKDPIEMEAIERAVDMAQKAFIATTALMQGDWTEKKVSDVLDMHIRQLGGAGSAFDTIVGVGERGALPHGRPSRKRIEEDGAMLIDWGANEGQYLSDLTRVVVTGKPHSKLEHVYRTVLEAQKAAIESIRPGATMASIDAVARGVIFNAGYGDRFTHSLGHGFGLEIHESVRLARGQDRVLETGMVVTVEPGVYLPGELGVRIEDDVLVTEDGYRVLSTLPKEWDEIVAK